MPSVFILSYFHTLNSTVSRQLRYLRFTFFLLFRCSNRCTCALFNGRCGPRPIPCYMLHVTSYKLHTRVCIVNTRVLSPRSPSFFFPCFEDVLINESSKQVRLMLLLLQLLFLLVAYAPVSVSSHFLCASSLPLPSFPLLNHACIGLTLLHSYSSLTQSQTHFHLGLLVLTSSST